MAELPPKNKPIIRAILLPMALILGIILASFGMQQAFLAKSVAKEIFQAAHVHNWFWADGWFNILMEEIKTGPESKTEIEPTQALTAFKSSLAMTDCFSSTREVDGGTREAEIVLDLIATFKVTPREAREITWVAKCYGGLLPELELMRKSTDMGSECSRKMIALLEGNRWRSNPDELRRLYNTMRAEEDAYSRNSFIISEKADNALFLAFGLLCLLVAGLFVHIIHSAHKTSQKKQLLINNRLAGERRFADSIIQSMPGLFYVFDHRSNRFIRRNDTWERVTGYSAAELKEMKAPDFFTAGDDQNSFLEEMGNIPKGGFSSQENRIKTKSGALLPFLLTGCNVERDGDVYLVGMGVDLSSHKEAEKERNLLQVQLMQSQKMEAVGRLAGGIAHDFNNMLSVIIGSVELAEMKTPKDSDIADELNDINRAALRSAELTRQLLTFSRKQIIKPKVLSLAKIVGEQRQMLGRLIGEEIDIVIGAEPDVGCVFIDPTQIDQILTNLLVNARDAIGGVGTITINISRELLEADNSREDMPVKEGEYVLLSVSDTGKGMDAETIKMIFEPFFTTKSMSEGTGLGLATVYGIVKQNNGLIHAYSEQGLGTSIKIFLPRHMGGEEGESQLEEINLDTIRGSETIMLVEDEGDILKLASGFLERHGYNVITAPNPTEAISTFKSHQGRVDLLVTDVVMPGMNGKQLQEELSAIDPELKALFMSGYSANFIAERGVLESGVEFIGKPFGMKVLGKKVRSVLDGRP